MYEATPTWQQPPLTGNYQSTQHDKWILATSLRARALASDATVSASLLLLP